MAQGTIAWAAMAVAALLAGCGPLEASRSNTRSAGAYWQDGVCVESAGSRSVSRVPPERCRQRNILRDPDR